MALHGNEDRAIPDAGISEHCTGADTGWILPTGGRDSGAAMCALSPVAGRRCVEWIEPIRTGSGWVGPWPVRSVRRCGV